MAPMFDITHRIDHGIAGLLGVVGFPIAALLLTRSMGKKETRRPVRKTLLWMANLSWISVLLLVATLAIMTAQVARANGGHLPQHAPKSLPPGVVAIDGWADRLTVRHPISSHRVATRGIAPAIAWSGGTLHRGSIGGQGSIPTTLSSPASIYS